MEDSDYSGNSDAAAADRDAPRRSLGRRVSQQGFAEVKGRAETAKANLLDHDNKQIKAGAETAAEVIEKARKKARHIGGAVTGAAQRKVGLEDLVVELGENLESALLVIASQRDRIEQLEARLGRLEQES